MLSSKAVDIIASEESELAYSTVSLWEIAIKNGLRRADFEIDLRSLRQGLIENGYREVAMLAEHVYALDTLPLHHKDPFDRMLVAQAIAEDMTLLTADRTLAGYGDPVRQV